MGVLIDLDSIPQKKPIQNGKQCASEITLNDKYLLRKNKLGEFVSKEDKKEARDNLDIKADNIPYTISDYEDIHTVKQALDKILRKPLTINSFTSDVNVYDSGDYLNWFNLSWNISKQPTKLTLYINNEKVNIDNVKSGIKNITGKFIGNVSVRLEAQSSDEIVTRSITIQPVIPLYFGINPDYTKDQKILTASTSGTITITAETDQFIYLITPFKITQFVNGFEGGFETLDPFTITTKLNNTIKYYVYRSDYAGLGKTTIQWQQK